ncbi:MAG: LysM peptidoglycan-binding domain-containing protein [Lachnospiraceae bacterium]|nr:LysM peptidoglycan-binding domain-containing protein [Lachnospiraceae bacterium]
MRSFRRYLQVAVFTIFFALVLSGFASINHTVQAESTPEPERYYTSIRIEQGDTLWEISSRYKWDGQTTQGYIDEVMEMNHLTSDQITAGQYIMIYYYK